MHRALLVLLALALAGCALPASERSDCRPGLTAGWEDPALFAALWETEALEVERHEPEPGLPGAIEEMEPYAPYAVMQVWWQPPATPPEPMRFADDYRLHPRWGPKEGPLVMAFLDPRTPNEEIRERFMDLAGRVTNASEAELAAWADAFVANRSSGAPAGEPTRGHAFEVKLPHADVTALAAHAAATGEPRTSFWTGPIGTLGVAYGEYDFQVSLRTARTAWEDGDRRATLTADAGGRVQYIWKGDHQEGAAELALAGVYDRLGLGTPPAHRLDRLPDAC